MRVLLICNVPCGVLLLAGNRRGLVVSVYKHAVLIHFIAAKSLLGSSHTVIAVLNYFSDKFLYAYGKSNATVLLQHSSIWLLHSME